MFIFETSNHKMYLFHVVNMKPNKTYMDSVKSNAAGYDGITPVISKYSSISIALPLTHIISYHFATVFFSEKLKITKAVSIH